MEKQVKRKFKNIWSYIKVNNGIQKFLRIGGILLGSLLLLYVISNLNIMFIEEIEVVSEENLNFITKEKVKDLLVENIGKRLYQINIPKEERRIKDKCVFVKEISLEKIFPKILKAEIKERKALIVLIQPVVTEEKKEKTEKYMISEDMYVLANCSNYVSDCKKLPHVELKKDIIEFEVEDKIDFKSLKNIQRIELFLKNSKINSEKYYIPEEAVIVTVLQDQKQVVFTSEKSIDDQLKDFAKTRQALLEKEKDYKEIDMRYNRPVVRVDKYTLWMTE